MIFAAIADIHGNCAALEAVLEDIASLGIKDVVNLGDCFSGPLEAGFTGDVLVGNWIPSVLGNHDRELIERAPEEMGSWERPAHAQLTAAHLDWLHTLPFSMVFKDVAYCCHGSPRGDLEYWLETLSPEGVLKLRPLSEIEAMADGITQPLMLCGHTHIARTVQLSDGRLIVNPGSVGCPGWKDDTPFDHHVEVGHPLASYAVLEETARGWQVYFRQIRYDNLAMAEMAKVNGIPYLADALENGWLKR
ncbi:MULTISPECIES: metallophosphoesterase family protein [Rhizobium/Agrobacterium group]|uniref:metallophosphoesterase family protein n=1 Tax=Rhizobium/Agrobacterium group TaxID=227290 RepID=UPI000DD907A6|nr:metallophosphoesterase family protein [Rhizobium sp. SJZ105]AYM11471.1 DNA methylase [Agrobacterium tumefaciens]NSY07084.1 metallophosphoesterase family protein [Agrobacterium tumefaciens]NSY90869.1 metallophosphoesterase family protein [Agrobacterium tumefaciens]NSZ06973.1 metallophosphoesterase family protein [Agrobacterium tumefaciens]TWC83847.1 calcineurin-like phosphoesterase family protein [Rhizobium sp. SJZ105]